MKNIKNKYWILCFILFVLNSCDLNYKEDTYFYQLENKTGQDIEVRRYFHYADGAVRVVTEKIENEARGIKYSEYYDL